jgi:serine/threonine-protein kinase
LAAQVLADRYELHERLGSGSMGEVWSATDLRSGDAVAVKRAQAWALSEPDILERFERESDILKRLKSPFICALVDAGRGPDDLPYIVLERLNGETLEQLLEREGYLPMDEVGRIADEILQALVVAHGAGIVHRDLSPSNVFLHRTPEGRALTKVVDFGIAKVIDDASSGRTGGGATMGSLPYAAPEQLGDSANAGPRADLYALGTLVFRALSGRLPYGDARRMALIVLKRETEAPTIDEVTGEKWPTALRTFLARTIARAPAKRYTSADVALAAWREAMQGRGPRLEMPEKPDDATPTLTISGPNPNGKKKSRT